MLYESNWGTPSVEIIIQQHVITGCDTTSFFYKIGNKWGKLQEQINGKVETETFSNCLQKVFT